MLRVEGAYFETGKIAHFKRKSGNEGYKFHETINLGENKNKLSTRANHLLPLFSPLLYRTPTMMLRFDYKLSLAP